ncbi:LOW QUALITY PROTEIN: kinesin-like protein KIF22-B [Saccoglossus kowalevskii]
MMKKAVNHSRVQVVVRLRPVLDEAEIDVEPCVRELDGNSLEIFNWRNNKETLKYRFDAFYGKSSSQEEVFESSVASLLVHTLNGQNASVFAYGATGTGKTHTMLGRPGDIGVIPRSVQKILSVAKSESATWKYSIQFSYLEIYQERVYDLLVPKNHDLQIREDRDRNIIIPSLAVKEITSYEQFQKYFIPASHNRYQLCISHYTKMFTLLVTKVQQAEPFRKLTGKLLLIDLAGSEDNKRTGNQGIRLKESGAINVSLFVLGQVVDALNQGLPRIPYRDSKLTRLLQDSLGGTAHACMVTNIAPEERNYMDTYTTLNFAAKSRQIVNKPFTRESTEKPSRVTLKRKASDEHRPSAPAKKMASQESTPIVNARVNVLKQQVLQPFLSPILRKHDHFAESVVSRLENLERNILNHMKQPVQPVVPPPPPQENQQDILKQLKKCREQLKEVQQQNQRLTKEKTEEEVLTSDCLFQRVPLIKKKSRSKLGTRCDEPSYSGCSQKDRKPLSAVNGVSTDVQFVKIIPECNSVSKESNDALDVSGTNWTVKLNPELQEKHNAEILNVINSGTVKQLKSLQSIGEKRAKLIYDWRQLNGQFRSIEELQRVNGLTRKTVESIVKNNLLSKVVFQ